MTNDVMNGNVLEIMTGDGCKRHVDELNRAGVNRAVLTLSPGTRSPPRRCHCLGDPFSFYDTTQVTKILSTKVHCKRNAWCNKLQSKLSDNTIDIQEQAMIYTYCKLFSIRGKCI